MVRLILAAMLALMATLSGQAARAQTAPPPEDYGKLPAMEMVTLSPSGARYAFVVEVKGERRIVVATTENTLLRSVPVGKVKVVGLEWAGDDHLMITTSTTVNLWGFVVAKNELGLVFALNVATGKLVTVFGQTSRVAKTVVGTYGAAQIGGRWYGFFGGYSYQGDGALAQEGGKLYADLYRVDLDTGEIDLAGRGQPDLQDWLVGPDGTVVARSFYNERSGDWRITGEAHGHVELAKGRNPLGGAVIRSFGRTSDSVIIETPGPDGAIRQEIPLVGGPAKLLDNNQMTYGELVDPITHLWIGTIEENDNLTAHLFGKTPEAKIRAAEKAFPGAIVHLISYSADFKRLVVKTEGGEDAGVYWVVGFEGGAGKAEYLGSEYPTIPEGFIGPVRMIDYKAADGLALRGVLTLPPGRAAKGLPVVVMPHGGPEYRDYPGFDYWAQAFAVRGYAVFQPNFRGSSGYGKPFRDAGFGQWGRKMQTDVSDGLAELARQGIVDPTRACIVGGSYGGYAALAGVTVQQHLYRCAVSLAGVADLARSLDYVRDSHGDVSAGTRYWKKFLGMTQNWSNTEVSDISPAKLADRADAPILLIHGTDDTVVPIEQSQVMERALKSAGKPVEFVTLKGADHWLLEESARVAMLKASVDFVMKYDPPDPAVATVAAK